MIASLAATRRVYSLPPLPTSFVSPQGIHRSEMEGGGSGEAFGSSTAPLTWHDFLERMRHPSAADFVKSIKSFIVSFSNRAPDPEKDSASVQEFLSNMEEAFRAHTLWAGSSEEELESAGEICSSIESMVSVTCYADTWHALRQAEIT
ncbi:hypothetical protein ZIOFF_076040 [Zingiber officinale]|uniref:RABX5 catalytic core helical domain-containing protein n=1 Tax=Zingiber officinale TaxID=94328 RepID=A0A8J5EMD2_ZINOF|nr:hypothetical protein ZIOFF_076040 [Zingiber officinale]